MTKEFNIYDEVFILDNNQISKRIVYSRTHVMDTSCFKHEVAIRYKVVTGIVGNCDDRARGVSIDSMFATKEELIASLESTIVQH